MKRKFYNLSLTRYLGRVSYYKSSEKDNPYVKEKIDDYQEFANSVDNKIAAVEHETAHILELSEAVKGHISGLEATSEEEASSSPVKNLSEPSSDSGKSSELPKPEDS